MLVMGLHVHMEVIPSDALLLESIPIFACIQYVDQKKRAVIYMSDIAPLMSRSDVRARSAPDPCYVRLRD